MPTFSLHLLKMVLVATGVYLLGQTSALRHFPTFTELDFPTKSLSLNASLHLADSSLPADICVIGSSIAMRNILAEEIENATGRSCRTISGLGMPASMLVPTARELGIENATIVFPLPIKSLGSSPSQKDNLYKVDRWWTPPPLDATWQRLRLVSLPNTERGHMQFDAWGNAPFADSPNPNKRRTKTLQPGVVDTTGVHALCIQASEYARENNCKIVLTTHHSLASRGLDCAPLTGIARLIRSDFPELEWVDLTTAELSDESFEGMFNDNYHFNASGARFMTRELCARTSF